MLFEIRFHDVISLVNACRRASTSTPPKSRCPCGPAAGNQITFQLSLQHQITSPLSLWPSHRKPRLPSSCLCGLATGKPDYFAVVLVAPPQETEITFQLSYSLVAGNRDYLPVVLQPRCRKPRLLCSCRCGPLQETVAN